MLSLLTEYLIESYPGNKQINLIISRQNIEIGIVCIESEFLSFIFVKYTGVIQVPADVVVVIICLDFTSLAVYQLIVVIGIGIILISKVILRISAEHRGKYKTNGVFLVQKIIVCQL